MGEARRRYVVGARKIPYAARDVAHSVLTPDDQRAFFDILGADTPDDDPAYPVGSTVAYRVELTDAEAARFRAASNCRYVELDVQGESDAGIGVSLPPESSLEFMRARFPRHDLWHGRDVRIAVLDGGVSTAVREAMEWTLVGRAEFATDEPGLDEITNAHGCQVAPCAVPRGGLLLDAVVSENNNTASLSNVAAGLVWAVGQGAKVVNISISGPSPSSPIEDALDVALAAGVQVFCSCGNTGVEATRYPAGYSDSYTNVHSSINFNETTGARDPSSTWFATASGCAPGSAVAGMDPGGNLIAWSGTSASTPHMTGLAARGLTGGRYTPPQVGAALKAHTRNLGQADQGGGAYDLHAALTALGAFTGLPVQTYRRNLATNPSFEVATGGWAVESTRTGITATAVARATTIPTPAGTGYGFTNVGSDGSTDPVVPDVTIELDDLAVTAGVTYTFSVLSRHLVSAADIQWRVTWRNGVGDPLATVLGGRLPLLTNVWLRYFITATAPVGAVTAELRILGSGFVDATARSWRWDGLLLEPSGVLGSYFDGSTSGATWDGTAHASTSYLGTPPVEEPPPVEGGLVFDGDPLWPGETTFPGPDVYPGGPPLGSPFLVEQLSPYARMAVEVAWGANLLGDPDDWIWADVTGDVRQDSGVRVTIGKGDEASKSQPAKMVCTLDNRLGRYSIGSQSPNYPFVRRGVPIRVSVNLGEHLDQAALPGKPPGFYPGQPLVPPAKTWRILFQGRADGFSPEWDTTGRDATAQLSASGVFRRMKQGTAPAPSVARRNIPRARTTGLLAYWPCEDGPHSTSIAAAVDGAQPMTIVGSPNLAKSDKFRISDPILQVHNATLVGQLPAYDNSLGKIRLNFLCALEDEGTYPTTAAQLVTLYCGGGSIAYIAVCVSYVNNSMFLRVRKFGATTNVLASAGLVGLLDRPRILGLDVVQNGADVELTSRLVAPGAAASFFRIDTLAGESFGRVTRVVVHGNPAQAGDLNLCGIGHIAVAADPDTRTGNSNANFIRGYSGEVGELAHQRISRLAAEENLPATVIGTSTSTCAEQSSAGPLDLLEQAAEVDQGILLDGLGPGITFIARSARESKAAAMTIDVSRGELAKELGVAADDQGARNSAEVTRVGGQSATFTDTDGPMGTGTIGLYDDSRKINMLSDTAALDYAAWLVRLGTVEGYRYPRINLDLAARPHLAADWVTLLPSSRIDLVNVRTVRTQLPDDTVSLILEGYTQTLSRFRWDVTANCSPADPWRVAVLARDEDEDDQLTARAHSDGTTTTAGALAAGTALQVVTPTGPAWTTDPDDYPIVLDVGGFEVTALSCTPSSGGTQTFTIEPAPGLLPPGAVVDLWKPPAPGL